MLRDPRYWYVVLHRAFARIAEQTSDERVRARTVTGSRWMLERSGPFGVDGSKEQVTTKPYSDRELSMMRESSDAWAKLEVGDLPPSVPDQTGVEVEIKGEEMLPP